MKYEDLKYNKKKVYHEQQLDKESKQVLKWIGMNKYVLEIGCHTGCLSEWINNKGSSVFGVDINTNAMERAIPFLKKSHIGNIEENIFWEKIDQERFDTITYMHVLEHLVDPWETLRKSRNYLNPGGEIIIAIPNLNNARDRFNIFFGKFNYTVDGVMDRTHLRFFNQKTARELIDQAGLEIIDYYSPWQVNPTHYFLDHLPLFWRMKKLFPASKVSWIYRNKKNLTDVVMLFRCRIKHSEIVNS